jgi:hypothetical protein
MPEMVLGPMPRTDFEGPMGQVARGEEIAFRRVFRLLEKLKRWCAERSSLVKECYLSADTTISLFVIARSEVFDFELNDDLAAFSVSLVRDGYPVYASLLTRGAAMKEGAFADPSCEVFKLTVETEHA